MNPDAIPALHPPRPEIPPGIWEQHGPLIVLGIVLVVAALCLLAWFLLRRRPSPGVPAQVIARQELHSLEGVPETGALFSRVSQVVRHYIGAAFGLPPVEMTTTEFAESLKSNGQVGPDLAGRVTDFLRDCDRRKFAPGAGAPSGGVVAAAEDLVAAGERRQAERRQAAAQAAPDKTVSRE
jgi:hypothetical protein